jgi:hypothetical protein
MRHRLGKGVIGLAACLAICLQSLPASANTKNLEFVNVTGTTPGVITVYNADEEALTGIAIPGPAGATCSTDPTTSTAIAATLASSTPATDGTITLTYTNACGAFLSGTTRWCSYTTWTIGGTYDATKNYSSTSVINVILKKNTGTTHNCHSVSTSPWCTAAVTGISVTGLISSAIPLPTLTNSDTATVAATSSTGSLVVSGTATTCGLFIAANNGSVSINAKVHVVH